MRRISNYKSSLFILALHLILVIVFSVILPSDRVIPTQWDVHGEVGSYSSKAFGLWFLWGINAFLNAVFIFFPYIDPRYKEKKERFEKVLPSLLLLLTFFLLLMHLYMLLWAIGVDLIRDFNGILLLVGLLFMFLGNMLPRFPSNWYAGYRSPWTLSSESVWRKTHRLGGYCFFIAGLLLIARGFYTELPPAAAVVFMVAVLSLCLFPYLYSYRLYMVEKRDTGNHR